MPQPYLQARRALCQGVVQRVEKIRKFLLRPVKHIIGKESAPRTEFRYLDLFWRVQSTPHLFELTGQLPPEDCVHITRGIEITGFSELLCISRVVTQFRS